MGGLGMNVDKDSRPRNVPSTRDLIQAAGRTRLPRESFLEIVGLLDS